MFLKEAPLTDYLRNLPKLRTSLSRLTLKGNERLGFRFIIQAEGGDRAGSRASTSNSTDKSMDSNKPHSINPFRRGLRKLNSVFHRSLRTPQTKEKSRCLIEPEPVKSPHANIRALNNKEIGVKWIVDDTITTTHSAKAPKDYEKENRERNGPDSPQKGNAKDMAMGILKNAGKSLKYALSRKESSQSRTDAVSTSSDNHTASQYDSSDESSLPSTKDVTLGVTDLVIPSSIVYSAASRSGNESIKTEDNINQTNTLSGTNSFKSKNDIVQT
ncbi:Hypothetical predicted protein [Olea europaea subsp. europaea]|uniref:Uncharacterized protein n=1 Tax=Olea europaea subsp. europaea TaxID=158383 RepID=A0A8S0V6J6_OLEEU|nr:Hypothetical predicted protein [Olea europaea subsp. europaea]